MVSFYVGLAPAGNQKMVQPPIRKKMFFHITMSDNKLVKTIMDAATLTGLAAGIGWASKKVLKEDLTANPRFIGAVL